MLPPLLRDAARPERATYDRRMSTDGPPIPPGLILRPFRALRFAASVDLASSTTPPYDVTDGAEHARLEARSRHNAVRLILPRAAQEGAGRAADPYTAAAYLLGSWQREGVLQRGPQAALYVYEQAVDGHIQRGRLGGVGLAR